MTVAPAKEMVGSRYCPSPSLSEKDQSAKSRIRVLIQMMGTLGHRKCLIGGLGAIAERVIWGLLTGEEEIVGAVVEVGKKGKGGKKDSGPAWDVAPCEDYC
jgi:hypothetical protein